MQYPSKYDDIDLVNRIKIQLLRWLGHVARMDSSNPVRKVFESEPDDGSRRQRRPRQRWTKLLGEKLTTLGPKLKQLVMYSVEYYLRPRPVTGCNVQLCLAKYLIKILRSFSKDIGLEKNVKKNFYRLEYILV